MTRTRFAIRYESRSTVDGAPVGRVFALDVGYISPTCWSYVDDPTKATLFTTWHAAEAVRQRHHWPASDVVRVAI